MSAAKKRIPAQMYARVKPYNPKRGFKIRRFSVFGIRFNVDEGWYKIDSNVADYLKTVLNDNNDPDSKPAFDVEDETGVRKITAREEEARIKKGTVQDPIQVSTDRADAREEAQARAARATAEQVGNLSSSADADAALGGGDTGDATGGDLTSADLPKPPDKLTRIEGVGDVTAKKLKAAGFTTFASIVEADPGDLEAVLGGKAAEIQEAAKAPD